MALCAATSARFRSDGGLPLAYVAQKHGKKTQRGDLTFVKTYEASLTSRCWGRPFVTLPGPWKRFIQCGSVNVKIHGDFGVFPGTYEKKQ